MSHRKTLAYALLSLALGIVIGYYIGFDQGFDHGTAIIGSNSNPINHAPRPNTPADKGLKTFRDEAAGIRFRYPETLDTKYIHTVDWPPKAEIHDEPFACTEAGALTDSAGKTEKRNVGDRTYCVTEEAEGAAGSIYTRYAYAFARDNKTAILTFTLRSVQCANYGEEEQDECDIERKAFNPDVLIDPVAQSLEMQK